MNIKMQWLFLFWFLFLEVFVANAQDHTINLALINEGFFYKRVPIFNKNGQVDLIDLANGLLNKFPNRAKDTGKTDIGKLHSSLLPGFGYSLQTNFEIELSYLGGFYTSKKSDANQSSIQATAIYTQLHQLLIPSVASIWLKDNHYNLQTDWRYLIYPQTTYGLGGYSTIAQSYILNFTNLRLYTYLYKVIQPDMYVGLGYDLDYIWNVHEVNAPTQFTDYYNYNKSNNINSTTTTSSAPTFSFLYDTRRNSINPVAGNFVNIIYRLNSTLIGSSQNWQSLVTDLRKYFPLTKEAKQMLAFWSYEWLTLSGTPPYILLPEIGGDPYANTGRGFADGRFRGKNMLYLEGEYRFGIMRNGLLGGVVFANTESFSEEKNNQFAKISAGYGAGIRIQFNKFSKTNVVFDYAFGSNGSKGLFLNLGEVF